MKETVWTIPSKASIFYPELKIQVIKKKSLYRGISLHQKRRGRGEQVSLYEWLTYSIPPSTLCLLICHTIQKAEKMGPHIQ